MANKKNPIVMEFLSSPSRRPPLQEKNTSKKNTFPVPLDKETKEKLYQAIISDPEATKMVMNMMNENKNHTDKNKKLKHVATPTKPTTPNALMHRAAYEKNKQRRMILEQKAREELDFIASSPVRKQPKKILMIGVNAFIDVNHKSQNKFELVKSLLIDLGARVSTRLDKTVTHVIYKDGKYENYKAAKRLHIPLVSLLWIDAINKTGVKVSEKNYPALSSQTNYLACCEMLNKMSQPSTATVTKQLDKMEKNGQDAVENASDVSDIAKLAAKTLDLGDTTKNVPLITQPQTHTTTRQLNFSPIVEEDSKITQVSGNKTAASSSASIIMGTESDMDFTTPISPIIFTCKSGTGKNVESSRAKSATLTSSHNLSSLRVSSSIINSTSSEELNSKSINGIRRLIRENLSHNSAQFSSVSKRKTMSSTSTVDKERNTKNDSKDTDTFGNKKVSAENIDLRVSNDSNSSSLSMISSVGSSSRYNNESSSSFEGLSSIGSNSLGAFGNRRKSVRISQRVGVSVVVEDSNELLGYSDLSNANAIADTNSARSSYISAAQSNVEVNSPLARISTAKMSHISKEDTDSKMQDSDLSISNAVITTNSNTTDSSNIPATQTNRNLIKNIQKIGSRRKSVRISQQLSKTFNGDSANSSFVNGGIASVEDRDEMEDSDSSIFKGSLISTEGSDKTQNSGSSILNAVIIPSSTTSDGSSRNSSIPSMKPSPKVAKPTQKIGTRRKSVRISQQVPKTPDGNKSKQQSIHGSREDTASSSPDKRAFVRDEVDDSDSSIFKGSLAITKAMITENSSTSDGSSKSSSIPSMMKPSPKVAKSIRKIGTHRKSVRISQQVLKSPDEELSKKQRINGCSEDTTSSSPGKRGLANTEDKDKMEDSDSSTNTMITESTTTSEGPSPISSIKPSPKVTNNTQKLITRRKSVRISQQVSTTPNRLTRNAQDTASNSSDNEMQDSDSSSSRNSTISSKKATSLSPEDSPLVTKSITLRKSLRISQQVVKTPTKEVPNTQRVTKKTRNTPTVIKKNKTPPKSKIVRPAKRRLGKVSELGYLSEEDSDDEPRASAATQTKLHKPVKYVVATQSRSDEGEVEWSSDENYVSEKKVTEKPINTRTKHIVWTQFNQEESLQLTEIIQGLGGCKTAVNVSNRTTHLVCKVPVCTINLLRGLIRGVWILRSNWVFDSQKAGKWLSEAKYEMVEYSPAVATNRLLREVCGRSHREHYFALYDNIYVSDNCHPSKEILLELIQSCEGPITDDITKADVIIGNPGIEVANGQVVVKEKWVMDNISKCGFVALNDYMLNQTSG